MCLRVILENVYSISNTKTDTNFKVIESLETLPKITTKQVLRARLVVILKSFLTFLTFENFYYSSVKKAKNVSWNLYQTHSKSPFGSDSKKRL